MFLKGGRAGEAHMPLGFLERLRGALKTPAQTKTRKQRFRDAGDAEGRYKLLVERISDYAIYMLDPGGIITTWNAGAQRMKGYAAEEIIGRHFSVRRAGRVRRSAA
jgi:PAS domain-containing protein